MQYIYPLANCTQFTYWRSWWCAKLNLTSHSLYYKQIVSERVLLLAWPSWVTTYLLFVNAPSNLIICYALQGNGMFFHSVPILARTWYTYIPHERLSTTHTADTVNACIPMHELVCGMDTAMCRWLYLGIWAQSMGWSEVLTHYSSWRWQRPDVSSPYSLLILLLTWSPHIIITDVSSPYSLC